MPCRGVLYSLSQEVDTLRGLDAKARVNHLHETIEEDYFANHADRLAETDKAWDAMHRTLTNGLLEWQGGDYPLTHVILGGENIGTEDDLLSVKTTQQVRDVAAALLAIAKPSFRKRYDAIGSATYEGPHGDQDFEYTWAYFEDVRTFWNRAASEGRSVLFSVGL